MKEEIAELDKNWSVRIHIRNGFTQEFDRVRAQIRCISFNHSN